MFSFVEKFYSNKDIEQALPQLQDAITKKLSVKQCSIENGKLCFALKHQDGLSRNSFRPKVEIRAIKGEKVTLLHAHFALQGFAQVGVLIYLAMAGLLELVVFGIFLAGNLSTPLLLLLPVGLGAFACLLAWCALRASAKSVTRIISNEGWKKA